ncbi:MAG: hypothetical protein Ct9H90mP16_07350 [Candidatus Poseidoniales archaeon]|nr:MAG: hypothetical protein Ct9H90mP16_07350 [Candidatus Poseidoniales archaeon]
MGSPSARAPQMELDFTGCEVNCPSMVLTIGRGRRNFSLRSISPSEQDVGYPGPALCTLLVASRGLNPGDQSPRHCNHPSYYVFGTEVADGDSNPNTIPDGGVGAWVLDQFVPHGYAPCPGLNLGSGNPPIARCKGLGKTIWNKSGVDGWVTGMVQWQCWTMGKSMRDHQLGSARILRSTENHRPHFRKHRCSADVLPQW